jgi:3',5'-cyclic AMP phosphodiesterase CpdA
VSVAPYLIQISDTHLLADTNLESYGVNPYQNLERVIAHISHLDPPPTFVIFTGDLISDDNPRSYRHLKLLANRLESPVYFAMGNHDLRQPFRRIVLEEASPGSEPYFYAFDTAGYRFVVLDSVVEGQVAGELDATQLAWLDSTLADGSQQRTVLFMHHPPLRTGVDWLDAYPFGNGGDLLDVLAAHRQLQRVFFGHVHMPIQITERGIQFSSAPSSAYQFGDTVSAPKVCSGSPGYGIVHLLDGQLSSRVVYL